MRHKIFRLCVVLLCMIAFVYFKWFNKVKDSSYELINEHVDIFQYDDIFDHIRSSNSFNSSFQIVSFNHIDKNGSFDMTNIKMRKNERSVRIQTLKDVFDLLYKSNSFLLDINYINSFSMKSTQSLLSKIIGSKFQHLLKEYEETESNQLKFVTFGINSKHFFSFNQVFK
jgi:hypothetical protein